MKIRASFVSNSSSSSFVFWGGGAEEFALHVADARERDLDLVASDVFYALVQTYQHLFDRLDHAVVDDEVWKKSFLENPSSIHRQIPRSIYLDICRAKDNWEQCIAFSAWFQKEFQNHKFYEIEFSDHEGETTYSEDEMDNIISEYSGPGFVVNNH